MQVNLRRLWCIGSNSERLHPFYLHTTFLICIIFRNIPWDGNFSDVLPIQKWTVKKTKTHTRTTAPPHCPGLSLHLLATRNWKSSSTERYNCLKIGSLVLTSSPLLAGMYVWFVYRKNSKIQNLCSKCLFVKTQSFGRVQKVIEITHNLLTKSSSDRATQMCFSFK